MDTQESSTTTAKRPPRAPSKVPTSGDDAPATDGDDTGRVASAYLQIFGRPPIGDHPELDGYSAGRTLAEEYPEAMQKVMSGFRRGVEEVQKSGEAGGERR